MCVSESSGILKAQVGSFLGEEAHMGCQGPNLDWPCAGQAPFPLGYCAGLLDPLLACHFDHSEVNLR